MHCWKALIFSALFVGCIGNTEPPSNLLVVGGFPKCSSSHIFRVLQAHPNIVTLGKQVGVQPGQELEFEEAAFTIARSLQVPGAPLADACWYLGPKGSAECQRLVGWIRGKYDNSTSAVLAITDIFFLEKKVMLSRWAGRVKMLLLVREPADYLWSAYNFWVLPGEPRSSQDDWTDKGIHKRSPEHFHELVLADGKMPAWQPRASKVTGLWFDLVIGIENISTNILVLKSEDFSDNVQTTLDRLGSFAGVSAAGFPSTAVLGRTNSQTTAGGRGAGTFQRGFSFVTGVYEISGKKPMLCATRLLIYSKNKDVCRVLSSSFGVHYRECLGDDPVDCASEHGNEHFNPSPEKIHALLELRRAKLNQMQGQIRVVKRKAPMEPVPEAALPSVSAFPSVSAAPLLEKPPPDLAEQAVPPNLLVVGGFPKCGSSHIYRMFMAHPNAATFSKQIGALPALELEFETAAFAIARTLQVPGTPLKDACKDFHGRLGQECARLAGTVRGKYDAAAPAVLVITDIFFLEKKVLLSRWAGKVKMLLLVREPADYLWSAYNFWVLPGEPKSEMDDWTEKGKHVRSPGHFHELVLADGKMPAWHPRADKVTGLWFNLVIGLRNISTNILVLKSEDFSNAINATLKRLGSFAGVSPDGFPSATVLGRTNSQHSVDGRGQDTFQRGFWAVAGVYEISRRRPMLCETRLLIYSKTNDVCGVLSSSFGVHYGECLGDDPVKCTNEPGNKYLKGQGPTKMITTTMAPITTTLGPSTLMLLMAETRASSLDVMAIPIFIAGMSCGLGVGRLRGR